MSSNAHIADGLAGLEGGADIQLVSDVVILVGPCCDAAFPALGTLTINHPQGPQNPKLPRSYPTLLDHLTPPLPV